MKISLAQMGIEFEHKEKNKDTCLRLIKQANEDKSDFIIFPEMTLTGFSMNTNTIAEENGETIEWFVNAAKSYNIHIGFGYVERQKNICKNKYTIVDSEGKVLLSYSKIHPFSYSEEDKFYEGGNEIFYARVKDFNTASFICYDLRFPEIFQIASKKASLIVVAANWPKSRRDNWITLLKARAIENQCYVAAVNVVGRINGFDYCGDSLIVDPIGNILSNGDSLEQLISSEIYLEEVHRYRSHFPVKKDRKEDLYKTIKAKQG